MIEPLNEFERRFLDEDVQVVLVSKSQREALLSLLHAGGHSVFPIPGLDDSDDLPTYGLQPGLPEEATG